MYTPLKRKQYGLTKLVEDIVQLLLSRGYADLHIYQRIYLKGGLRKVKVEIRNLIKAQLLGKEFKKALAQTIITEKGIDTTNPLFIYLKQRVYHGNSLRLLGDLQDAIRD